LKKITDLETEKVYYKFETNALGDKVKVPYTIKVEREVEYVIGWSRYGHYLIDMIVVDVVIIILIFGIHVFLPQFLPKPYWFWIGFSMLIWMFYYFIFESTMQRTVGKMLTKCIVINEYGNKPDISSIAARSVFRMIPFEMFSCLNGLGWHDQWSKTYVVTNREHENLRLLLKDDNIFYVDDRKDILD
jgi:uncharacterized RDD family membrane protein YckC